MLPIYGLNVTDLGELETPCKHSNYLASLIPKPNNCFQTYFEFLQHRKLGYLHYCPSSPTIGCPPTMAESIMLLLVSKKCRVLLYDDPVWWINNQRHL